jgi:ABC-type transport system involved in multi-copper enzyme maturation permease subunit
MATGSHGVRWQYNYTNDSAGLPGSVSAASPRWIRLTRDGDRLKGYDSANGERWTEIGSAYLPGLPLTVNVGLFVTSPVAFRGNNASPSKATATFDDISITSAEKSGVWRGQAIGTAPRDFYPTLGSGGFHRSGGTFVISGSGDIALGVGEGLLGTDTPGSVILIGIIASLLVMILLATVFITAEYRRGLIRTTFAVTPNRRRVLAAKTAVIGFVALVTGIIAATAAIPLGDHLLRANGNYVFPISTIAEMRIIFGSAALLSVTAMAVLGLGAIFRRSAGAVAGGLAVFILPSVAASFISGGAEQWLFCLTPAAGFAVLGGLPYSAQVSYSYNYANGYYPIAPWAGFLVVCAYAAVALGIATILVRRRDA